MSKKANDIAIFEGIMAQGYGQVPKMLVLDKSLPLESKALYGYLACYTGNGRNTAFPSIDTITFDMAMNRATIRKYMSQLVDTGYITVRQQNNNNTRGFSRNEYSLIIFPEKYSKIEGRTPSEQKKLDLIKKAEDIFQGGYGNVARSVMKNRDLDCCAKALYVYYSAFSYDGSILPSKKRIAKELLISRDRLARSINALEEAGLIISVSSTGRFKETEYILSQSTAHIKKKMKPHIIEDIPSVTEFCATEKQDTEISATEFSATEKLATENSATNNTYSSNNTLSNKTIVNNTIRQSKRAEILCDRPTDGAKETDFETMESTLADAGGLPYDYLYNSKSLECAVKTLAEWESRTSSAVTGNQQLYRLVVETLIEMLDISNAPHAKISPVKVYEALTPYIHASWCDGLPLVYLENVIDDVMFKYNEACKKQVIKIPKKYLERIWWSVLQTSLLQNSSIEKLEFAG